MVKKPRTRKNLSPDSVLPVEGEVRRHHEFYLSSGDLILEVEKTLFRIHRHFLIKHSQFWCDELVAQDKIEIGNSDHNPWALDDKVRGWELLLGLFYQGNPLLAVDYTSKENLDLLELACKYGMETFERTMISRLLIPSNHREEFIDLPVASRMVDSETLRTTAIEGLGALKERITIEEAAVIGLEEYYMLWNSSGSQPFASCASCGASDRLYCCSCGDYCKFE